MSIHLEAQPGQIAATVLIAGDPLRAQHYARHFLADAFCYNHVRGMFGFTGSYRGKRVSLQGTGIGIPSTALYVHELIHSYGVKRIIRVGTCGALAPGLSLGQVIVATDALTDSAAVAQFQKDESFPRPHSGLFARAIATAAAKEIGMLPGRVFSTDLFYSDDSARYTKVAAQGAAGVDMETSLLYAMGEKYGIETLSLLTVTDHILTGTAAPPEVRERQTHAMMELALELID